MGVAAQLDPRKTGRSSIALLGKDAADNRVDTDHGHAHYLAGSFDLNSRGRLDTLVIWAPMGLQGDDVDVVRSVAEVRGPGFPPCRLRLEAVGTVEEVAPSLAGIPALNEGSTTESPLRNGGVRPAARWRSVTPFAPAKHIRRRATWQDHARNYLEKGLEDAGLPPAIIRPYERDWHTFHRRRRREDADQSRRATGFVLEFARPVTGPICLGALRHFGLGLFLPLG